MECEVSVKDTLGLVINGVADQGELSEGVDVTVDTDGADQLGWQGSWSSFLDGHGGGWMEGRRKEEGEVFINRRVRSSESEGRRDEAQIRPGRGGISH